MNVQERLTNILGAVAGEAVKKLSDMQMQRAKITLSLANKRSK